MTLFNQLTFFALIAEIVIFVASLLPTRFISAKKRTEAFDVLSKLSMNEHVQWTSKIILFIILGVFVDTVMRLMRLESDSKDEHSFHQSSESAFVELQHKSKRFYAQRNLYLSSFTLFMMLVLYVRFTELYHSASMQMELEALKLRAILQDSKNSQKKEDAKTK